MAGAIVGGSGGVAPSGVVVGRGVVVGIGVVVVVVVVAEMNRKFHTSSKCQYIKKIINLFIIFTLSYNNILLIVSDPCFRMIETD